MIHFQPCNVCPVKTPPCIAQITGAAHAYCDRIRRGDEQAAAVAVDRSKPPAPQSPVVPKTPAAKG